MLWWAFCGVRYWVDGRRIEECIDLIVTVNQHDVCTRNAIEARDSIITWAFGVPLALLIGGSFLIWVLRAVRDERGQLGDGDQRH